jgi:hypothetical protein
MVRNPFVARGMIKSEKAFWGRESETQTIYSLLLDSEEEPQSVVIVGLRKIGKSSLLYRIAHKRGSPSMYVDQLDRTVCVMLSMQAMSTASTDQFFALLLEELRHRDDPVSEMLSTLPSQPTTGPAQELTQLLRSMDKEGYWLVLLLDEFECAATNPYFDKHFFDLLRSMAQRWRMAFIVATQNNLDELWDKSLISSPLSSPFFNFFQTLTLVGFRDEEVEDYLRTVSHEAEVPFGDVETAIIREIGGVHPFFINVAAYHLFQALTQPSHQLPPDRDALWMQITQDPTVSGNFKYYWQNLTPSRRRVLTEVAGGELGKPLPPDIRVDLDWLERMSLVRKRDNEVYEPFSKAFRKFALERTLGEYESELGQASQEKTIQDLISESESTVLEFKSSLRWDYHQGKPTNAVELAVVKTLAAFLNTDGGTLIIGVDDDGNILGLDKDYHSFRKKDRDGFELHVTRLVSDKLGKRFCQYIQPTFHSISGLDVCRIDVDVSPDPVYVGEEDAFYIRTHNSTQELSAKEAFDYIRRRWAAT